MRFKLFARTKGRRVGGVCRRQTRANRMRRSCIRLVRKASLTRQLERGTTGLRFVPKVKPGRYTLRAMATDAAGNAGTARSITVVVRR